jgi:hypothetical protein
LEGVVAVQVWVLLPPAPALAQLFSWYQDCGCRGCSGDGGDVCVRRNAALKIAKKMRRTIAEMLSAFSVLQLLLCCCSAVHSSIVNALAK